MSAPTIESDRHSFPGRSGADVPGADVPVAVAVAGGLDTAWRIHSSLSEWIGRVDVKASFALSLETAALVAIAGVAQTTPPPGTHSAGRQTVTAVCLWFSAVLVATALVFAIAAVAPRIGPRGDTDDRRNDDRRNDVIYFGHLRHWSADELTEALSEQDLLPALSRQLVVLSRIAWKKHVRVRCSLVLGGIGVTLAALPAMMISVVQAG
ncbi:Pycsar system effector family protein [Streptomyces sp. NRRL WC-3742]|uniref:Pycsar system effector family protein n=1 Tax=Streptomyces sp. NRRL WC-3742 TaxID=1463934 RepID=UPI000691214E|nr:Pycsar system effector family protein [Streptomyces sp. NRRL WC-3742]